MTNDRLPDLAADEAGTAGLVQSALDGPSRPLRADQLEMLVRAAAAARQPVPGWALLFLAAGPLAVMVLVGLAASGSLPGFAWSGAAGLALAIPLANLALSPFAVLLLYARLVRRTQQGAGEGEKV